MTKREVIIPEKEFKRGIAKFDENEKLEFVYKYATDLINQHWSTSPEDSGISEIASALRAFLFTWNEKFYRLDSFEVVKLEIYIENNIQCIESFRNRDIFSLSDSDQDKIEDLFWSFFTFLKDRSPASSVERTT